MIQEAEKETFVAGISQQEENWGFFFVFYTNVLAHEREKVSEDTQMLCSHL